MEKFKQFVLNPKKINTGEKGKQFTKATIENTLISLKEKKQFYAGDFVTTLEGPYDSIKMLVVEKKENGIVRIAPEPNTSTIEIHESKLWHIDDYYEALNQAIKELHDTDLDIQH